MESVFWVCICIVSGVSKLWRHYYSWWRYGRAPLDNKIVVTRISEIPLCASHTGIWHYLPVLNHTTKECALKQNLKLSRFLIVSGSGVACGYLCGPTPAALVGAFAGGVAGGITFDLTVTLVLTHCSDDDEIVLFGHFESLHVLFKEGTTLNEYVRQILCVIFRIIVDGFVGMAGYKSIRFVQSLLKPGTPKIDLKRIQASMTKEYKELERLMDNANEEDKHLFAAPAARLRQELYDLIGDGDIGHKKRIDYLWSIVDKRMQTAAT